VGVAQTLVAECGAMNHDATWQLRGGTIMPDHLHLLVVLGERLTLGRTISRLKSKLSLKLREARIEWERDFFDHKLRADEPLLPLFLYLYLNPYRSGLITAGQKWPHFFCAADDWNWFKDHLQDDLPPPEWLR
jgi:REP element-mobilizing transposase RayT